jgi:hypothetical protein
VILVTGSNTTENHPVLSSRHQTGGEFKGAKLIVVDPRRIKLAEFAGFLAAAEPGQRRGLDQRHDARHHQGGSARQGSSSRNADRKL